MKRYAGALIVLAAAGALVALIAGDSTVATAIAIVLIGCASVGAVSLAFFAVGEAEERDRERAAAAREPEHEAEPPAPEHPRTLGLGPERRHKRPPRRPG